MLIIIPKAPLLNKSTKETREDHHIPYSMGTEIIGQLLSWSSRHISLISRSHCEAMTLLFYTNRGKNNEEERVGTEFVSTAAHYVTWSVKPTFLFPS